MPRSLNHAQIFNIASSLAVAGITSIYSASWPTLCGGVVGEWLISMDIDRDDIIYDMKISAATMASVGLASSYYYFNNPELKSFDVYVFDHPVWTVLIFLLVPTLLPLLANRLSRTDEFSEWSALALGGILSQALCVFLFVGLLESFFRSRTVFGLVGRIIDFLDYVIPHKECDNPDCIKHHPPRHMIGELAEIRFENFQSPLSRFNSVTKQYFYKLKMAALRPTLSYLLSSWHAGIPEDYRKYYYMLSIESLKHDEFNMANYMQASFQYDSSYSQLDRERRNFAIVENIYHYNIKTLQEYNRSINFTLDIMCSTMLRAVEEARRMLPPKSAVTNTPVIVKSAEPVKQKKRKKKKNNRVSESVQLEVPNSHTFFQAHSEQQLKPLLPKTPPQEKPPTPRAVAPLVAKSTALVAAVEDVQSSKLPLEEHTTQPSSPLAATPPIRPATPPALAAAPQAQATRSLRVMRRGQLYTPPLTISRLKLTTPEQKARWARRVQHNTSSSTASPQSSPITLLRRIYPSTPSPAASPNVQPSTPLATTEQLQPPTPILAASSHIQSSTPTPPASPQLQTSTPPAPTRQVQPSTPTLPEPPLLQSFTPPAATRAIQSSSTTPSTSPKLQSFTPPATTRVIQPSTPTLPTSSHVQSFTPPATTRAIQRSTPTLPASPQLQLSTQPRGTRAIQSSTAMIAVPPGFESSTPPASTRQIQPSTPTLATSPQLQSSTPPAATREIQPSTPTLAASPQVRSSTPLAVTPQMQPITTPQSTPRQIASSTALIDEKLEMLSLAANTQRELAEILSLTLTEFENKMFALLSSWVPAENHDYKIYMVGGWAYDKVRLLMYDQPPCLYNDIDFVTNIPPELYGRDFTKVPPVSGLYTAKIDTFKVDVIYEPDLSDLSISVKSRDFMTLFIDSSGRVFDPTGIALAQMHNRQFNSVNALETIFKEDPLLILRAAYLSTKRNLDLTPLKYMIMSDRYRLKPCLDELTSQPKNFLNPHRMNVRIGKLFSQHHAVTNFSLLNELGILEVLFTPIYNNMMTCFDWLIVELKTTNTFPFPRLDMIYALFIATALGGQALTRAMTQTSGTAEPVIDLETRNQANYIFESSLLFKDAFRSVDELCNKYLVAPLQSYCLYYYRKAAAVSAAQMQYVQPVVYPGMGRY